MKIETERINPMEIFILGEFHIFDLPQPPGI